LWTLASLAPRRFEQIGGPAQMSVENKQVGSRGTGANGCGTAIDRIARENAREM